MDFEHHHFIHTKMPREILEAIKRLKDLDSALSEILADELKAENLIADVSHHDELVVLLQKPFHQRYRKDDASFDREMDAHYGRCEFYRKNGCVVSAPFD